MKLLLRNGILAVALLCLAAMQGHAQAVSPRTGEKPRTQTLTLEEFNRMPHEIQAIVKVHPEMYIIDQKPNPPTLPTDDQEKNRSAQPGPIAPPTGPSQPTMPEQVGTTALPDHPKQPQP
jgi:hypothetical protein